MLAYWLSLSLSPHGSKMLRVSPFGLVARLEELFFRFWGYLGEPHLEKRANEAQDTLKLPRSELSSGPDCRVRTARIQLWAWDGVAQSVELSVIHILNACSGSNLCCTVCCADLGARSNSHTAPSKYIIMERRRELDFR